MWLPGRLGDLYFLIKIPAEAFSAIRARARPAPLQICISDSDLHPTHSDFEFES